MNSLIAVIGLSFFSLNAMAHNPALECPQTNEGIITLIKTQDVYCSDAMDIATQCAFGSTRDLEIVGAAKQVCLNEAGTLSSDDQNLLNAMDARCNKTYQELQGTMYRSMNAFCHLQAVSFVRNVQLNPEEL